MKLGRNREFSSPIYGCLVLLILIDIESSQLLPVDPIKPPLVVLEVLLVLLSNIWRGLRLSTGGCSIS